MCTTGRSTGARAIGPAEGPDRTRVVLEHRNLDRHGDGWEPHRDAVASAGGWQLGIDAFAAAVAAAR